jgi:elongation factor P--beta-lysine ligase
MAVKIYSAPTEIKKPIWRNSLSIDVNNANIKAYVNVLRKYLKKQGFKDKHCGTVVQFPVADSHAEFLVVTTIGTVAVIHLDTIGTYSYPSLSNMSKESFMRYLKSNQLDRTKEDLYI